MKDIIVVDKIEFVRQINSTLPHRRDYYWAHILNPDSKGCANRYITIGLHRYLYSKAYGKIAKKNYIHHKDGNPLNNDLSNLQEVTPLEHRNLHKSEANRLLTVNSLALAREAAKIWHKSLDGRLWHSEHAKTTLRKPNPVEKICEFCAIVYTILFPKKSDRCCSLQCQQALTRKEGRHKTRKKICPICGKDFMQAPGQRAKTCSRSCGFKARIKK